MSDPDDSARAGERREPWTIEKDIKFWREYGAQFTNDSKEDPDVIEDMEVLFAFVDRVETLARENERLCNAGNIADARAAEAEAERDRLQAQVAKVAKVEQIVSISSVCCCYDVRAALADEEPPDADTD